MMTAELSCIASCPYASLLCQPRLPVFLSKRRRFKETRNLRFACKAHEKPSSFWWSEITGGVTLDAQSLSKWDRGGGMVHENCEIAEDAYVLPAAVVMPGVALGPEVVIGPGAVIGENVQIGARTVIGPQVTLQNCRIGEDCIVHAGVRIGQDGFGFYVDNSGEMIKKPQTLDVEIKNNVEIGANSCIDRGSWRTTTIGEFTKIDNLVQIGHNASIGRSCILCGHAAVGGSASLGDFVVMGGKSGVADHIKICSHVRLAGKSGVTHDIQKPGDYAGFPAVPANLWRREVVEIRRQTKRLGNRRNNS